MAKTDVRDGSRLEDQIRGVLRCSMVASMPDRLPSLVRGLGEYGMGELGLDEANVYSASRSVARIVFEEDERRRRRRRARKDFGRVIRSKQRVIMKEHETDGEWGGENGRKWQVQIH